MTDTMTVRDHSLPCKHEGTYAAFINGEYWWCEECPGGKEITLRLHRCVVLCGGCGAGDYTPPNVYVEVDGDE